MLHRVRTVHRRADFALLGGVFVGVAGVACIFGINLCTEQSDSAAAAEKPALLSYSPDDLSRTQAAAENFCLAEVLYYEARGEGVEGEKAVAEVVFERIRNRNFPATICGVVLEGVQKGRLDCQFSFACDGSAQKPKDAAAWRQAQLLAEKINSGTVRLSGITGHAIAFHNVDMTPPWAETMLKTAQIGNHVFYRFAPHPLPNVEAADNASAINADSSAPGSSPAGANPVSDEVQPDIQTASAVGNGA